MTTTTILVVCTGNVRRSRVAAAALRSGTRGAGGLSGTGITVASAGTRAMVGHGVDPLIAAELDRRNLAADTGPARQLTADDVEAADLVIAIEREHRSAVVGLSPVAVRRTFTLRELAALGGQLGHRRLGSPGADAAQRLAALVEAAPLGRSTRVLRRPADDDLIDLRHRTPRAARRLVDDVLAPVETLLGLLAPEPALVLLRPAPVASLEVGGIGELGVS